MSKMVAVRFPLDMMAAVRRFARQDGKTVSQWIRDLVAREARQPNRQPAVDFSLYPQSRTVSSGAPASLMIEYPHGPQTSTGYW